MITNQMGFIFKQIILVNAKGNVQRGVWRMWILMLGCRGLNDSWTILFFHFINYKN